LSEAAPQVPRPRIQGLSDLIFGLALSIGAIQFVGNLPSSPRDLSTDLAEFGFGFLILINVWNRYTTTMSVMPVEEPATVRLNMLLLFLVAIEPFLLNVMFVRGFSTDEGVAASLYYGLDIGGMNLILAYFTHALASEEKGLVPRELIHRYKTTRNLLIVGAAIFLISDLPIFGALAMGGIPLRVILWILTLPVIWTQRLIGNRS
jgi:uncharacterized membrane protein